MARGGHKYPLIVYQHMLNRWWPAMIAIGLGMFALAYSEYIDPMAQFLSWRWQLFAGIGVLAILIGVFFLILRHLAYVQPFPEYLKLVTPFMRINISYKRIQERQQRPRCVICFRLRAFQGGCRIFLNHWLAGPPW